MAYGYETFVKNTIDVPWEEAEPICPFSVTPIECNQAYSDACLGCQEAIKAYRSKLATMLRNCAGNPAPCCDCVMFTDDSCTDTLLNLAAETIEESLM